jgi:hypothetical protein
VAFFYLEAKTGVLASDGGRQFVKTIERVIGDFQVEGREVQTIRIDNASIGQSSQKFDIGGGGSSRSFIPSSNRAWVAVLTVELPRSK